MLTCSYDPVNGCLCTQLDMDSACLEVDVRCDSEPGQGGAGGAGGAFPERSVRCQCGDSANWSCTRLE